MTDSSHHPAGQGRTILVLDDDRAIRAVMRRILERQGFRVVEAAFATAAFDELERAPEPFALIICDLVLPGLGGREAANIFQARAPDVPILFTSGYSSFSSGRREVRQAGHPFLGKPFDVQELIDAVSDTMGDSD